MTGGQANNERLNLGEGWRKLFLPAAAVGLLALVVSVIIPLFRGGDAHAWAQFFRSYLTAFIYVLTLSLGGLFFIVIQHLTRAGWSVVLRRLAEAVAANLTWLWLLFLPVLLIVLFGRGWLLYDWMDAAHRDPIIEGKTPFLNVGFWTIRAVFYFLVWGFAGWYFFSRSRAQDGSGDVNLTHRMQRWAPLTAILYGITQTFAAIDWIMSLEAHWFSTMFGVYFFAASCCGFFALLCVLMSALQRAGKLTGEITLEHYQDAGKQLFAFGIVFWAYIAFSQYMLIWYANIPEETGWYLARQLGAWKAVSVILLVGHFALPFLLLVTKHTKRRRAVITVIASWMLLMHFVDVYWLVMPQVPAEAMSAATTYPELTQMVQAGAEVGFAPSLTDLTCLVGMVGVWLAVTARRMGTCSLIPAQDPRLHESLAFENM
ncbi:MAG: hypothetical protein JSV91_04440 [Phycisphaerales bacterium]|nr:MAG: hypothetical protein JSV91_04440 [Phycisphaerales bacterium]